MLTTLVFAFHRGHGSEVMDVPAGESVEIQVYTRSTSGGVFSLHDNTKKTAIESEIQVKHDGQGEATCMVKLSRKSIPGPISIKVKADSNASRFSTQHFLLVFSFKRQ